MSAIGKSVFPAKAEAASATPTPTSISIHCLGHLDMTRPSRRLPRKQSE
jgi:hypothetical protein